MMLQNDGRVLDLFGIELPIIQAPMAGSSTIEMAIAVTEAGGLGSIPSALLRAAQLRAALDAVRAATRRPINVNFFVTARRPTIRCGKRRGGNGSSRTTPKPGSRPLQQAPAVGRPHSAPRSAASWRTIVRKW